MTAETVASAGPGCCRSGTFSVSVVSVVVAIWPCHCSSVSVSWPLLNMPPCEKRKGQCYPENYLLLHHCSETGVCTICKGRYLQVAKTYKETRRERVAVADRACRPIPKGSQTGVRGCSATGVALQKRERERERERVNLPTSSRKG